MNLGVSSVEIRVTVKTLNEQHYGIERALRKLIKETLDANNIEIPLPQIVVNKPREKSTSPSKIAPQNRAIFNWQAVFSNNQRRMLFRLFPS